MKTITGVIIGALIVVVVIMGVLSYQKNQKPANSGSLIIGVTDAAAAISDVNDINLSVKNVEVYSATKGWVSVSSDAKSYKLLTLNASGKTQLYAKANVPAGTYDKVRVTLGDVIVNTQSKGDVKAALPSSYVVVNTGVVVKENMNTSVTMDVLADKSLHATVDGGYVFAPVVKTESRSNATVSIGDDNAVSTSGGTIDASATVGVDFNGMSKANFEATSDSSLKVESSVMGGMKFLLGGKTYMENDVSGEATATGETSTGSSTDMNTSTNASGSNGSINVDLNNKIKAVQ